MFSVVIPLYNKSHTIGSTIASVLNQTFQDFEIVVVNDGSTDDGPQRARAIGDPRISVIDQPNQGVSAARNNAIRASTRPYIALLDGDDEWLPGFLESMRQAIAQFPAAGLFGCPSFHQDLATGARDDATLGRYRGQTQQVDYFQNPAAMPHTSAMVIARRVYQAAFPDGEGFPVGMKLCEDWSCLYRVALLAPFVYVGLPLAVRNNNVPGQVTAVMGEARRRMQVHIENFLKLTYAAAGPNMPTTLRRFYKYDLRHRILLFMRSGDREGLQDFMRQLDPGPLALLGPLERALYRRPALQPVAMAAIYASKLHWRSYGYPRVGSKH
jgi:glycosyltransferase involved in cell wall biosynthesis